MKKGILVGLIAVMMLFAFTACEPQTVDWPYYGDDAKDVVSITLVNPEDVSFYAGQSNSPVDTYVNIERLDGTVSRNVIATVAAPESVVPGRNTATVTWVSGTSTGTNEGPVFVEAETLSSLELELVATENVANEESLAIKTLKGVYTDGEEFDFSSGATIDYDSESGTASVTIAAGKYSSVAVTSNAVAVTLVEEPEEPTYITAAEATGIELVWYVNGERVDGPDVRVTVGDKVAYQVRGTKEGTAGCVLTTDNYDVSGTATALSNIGTTGTGYTTVAKDITDSDTEAYTIHVQFKGVEGSDNYSEHWTIDGTLTVDDTLEQSTAEGATFYYNPTAGVDGAYTGNGTLAAGVEHTFTTNEFKAQTATVGGVRVELTADAIRGKVTYAADEIVNNEAITIEFHWVAAGYPEIEGYSSVEITPSTVTE